MNFSFPNMIAGLICFVMGILMVKEAFNINQKILFLGWVEQKYGPGTGVLAYQLLGIAFCCLGFFTFFGYIDLFGSAFADNSKPVTQDTRFIPGSPNGGSIIAE